MRGGKENRKGRDRKGKRKEKVFSYRSLLNINLFHSLLFMCIYIHIQLISMCIYIYNLCHKL